MFKIIFVELEFDYQSKAVQVAQPFEVCKTVINFKCSARIGYFKTSPDAGDIQLFLSETIAGSQEKLVHKGKLAAHAESFRIIARVGDLAGQ